MPPRGVGSSNGGGRRRSTLPWLLLLAVAVCFALFVNRAGLKGGSGGSTGVSHGGLSGAASRGSSPEGATLKTGEASHGTVTRDVAVTEKVTEMVTYESKVVLLPQSEASGMTVVPASPSLLLQGKDRSPSDPFITGDGFRDACLPFVFDETVSKEDRWSTTAMKNRFKDLKDGDPVFVQTHLLMEFIDNVHSKVLQLTGVKYRLVTHNSDFSAPWEYSNNRGKTAPTEKSYKDQKEKLLASPQVIVWLAQNVIIEHPKLHAIPIGLENRYNKYGALPQLYLEAAKDAKPFASRSKLLYMNFNDKTNRVERQNARELIRKNFVRDGAMKKLTIVARSTIAAKKTTKDKRLVLPPFLAEMSEHQFVMTPHGHGIDTHRMWEALYMGCVPIITASAQDASLLLGPSLDLGLPVIVVKEYSEITAAFLEGKVREMSQNGLYPSLQNHDGGHAGGAALRLPALSMAYWRQRIRTFK